MPPIDPAAYPPKAPKKRSTDIPVCSSPAYGQALRAEPGECDYDKNVPVASVCERRTLKSHIAGRHRPEFKTNRRPKSRKTSTTWRRLQPYKKVPVLLERHEYRLAKTPIN